VQLVLNIVPQDMKITRILSLLRCQDLFLPQRNKSLKHKVKDKDHQELEVKALVRREVNGLTLRRLEREQNQLKVLLKLQELLVEEVEVVLQELDVEREILSQHKDVIYNQDLFYLTSFLGLIVCVCSLILYLSEK
jgi:hypothetical protein